MDLIELGIHRANTVAFIAANPTALILTPHDRVRVANGGYRYAERPLRPVQTLRIIELGTTTVPPVVRLQDGTERSQEFWLLGPYDAQMDVNDSWVDPDSGRSWWVADVIRSNRYETRGIVIEYGA